MGGWIQTSFRGGEILCALATGGGGDRLAGGFHATDTLLSLSCYLGIMMTGALYINPCLTRPHRPVGLAGDITPPGSGGVAARPPER